LLKTNSLIIPIKPINAIIVLNAIITGKQKINNATKIITKLTNEKIKQTVSTKLFILINVFYF
jgi:hypothetical protein